MKRELSRRQFLKGVIGGFSVVFLNRAKWLFPDPRFGLPVQAAPLATLPIQALNEVRGELYAGFLILSDIDQVALIHNTLLDRRTFTYYRYDDLPGIPSNIVARLFLPTLLPRNIVPIPNAVVELNKDTLAPRTVSVFYRSRSENLYLIDVIAQYDFIRPFPIVPGHDINNPAETPALAIIEKVDFTPQPGLMIATEKGYVVHWIADDILYTCISEFSSSRKEVIKLVSSLRQGNV